MKRNNILTNVYSDPTETILALVSKLSLCMLLFASSIIFFHSEFKKSPLPKIYRRFLAVSLILAACIISTFATYEFITIINKIAVFCSKNNSCLYDVNMLTITKYVYYVVAIIFITVCLFAARSMILF
jgi:hypothetical protein